MRYRRTRRPVRSRGRRSFSRGRRPTRRRGRAGRVRPMRIGYRF